jgi:predicted GH43/DUF377 family glycosyl hydrolase
MAAKRKQAKTKNLKRPNSVRRKKNNIKVSGFSLKKKMPGKRRLSTLLKKTKTKPKTKLLKRKARPVKRLARRIPLIITPNLQQSSTLRRSSQNPILKPTSESWETQATFNPGAVMADGRVHLIYRAIGNDDLSVFGYSSSKNGFTIDYRSPRPVYFAPASFEISHPGLPRYLSPSGGGYGGCEDPRVTLIDGRVYVTFTSWNGYEAPRVALASISVEDFLRKNWNWGRSVLISPPHQAHKNWVIFPEKINGKFAILHSITPDVLIDYFDNLDFDGQTFIESKHEAKPRRGTWDTWVRGVGPPPIKTSEGWLLIYHAIDDKDPGRYKLGAMLLDLKNPEKVLYRSSAPILAPDEVYENEGYKSGIVYSCGAAVIDGTLLVYYGAADTVGCVASADLKQFLNDLKKTSTPRMRKKIIVHS